VRETVLKTTIGTSMSTQWNLESVVCIFRKSVHLIEPHASWVQIDVNQFGLYYLEKKSRKSKTSTQGLD